ncbi:hypothetical protein [Burkholderia anthina]|uniref:hypothetical protein n=1 Tax=Burkholderia anthina TaxID=179879 RepID=UPI0012D8A3D8|nr:hypothetical protein [Burkholderia anthina]
MRNASGAACHARRSSRPHAFVAAFDQLTADHARVRVAAGEAGQRQRELVTYGREQALTFPVGRKLPRCGTREDEPCKERKERRVFGRSFNRMPRCAVPDRLIWK